MDNKKLVEALTTPKIISKLDLAEYYAQQIKASNELLQNALENDKVLVVGREAQRLAEATESLLSVLK